MNSATTIATLLSGESVVEGECTCIARSSQAKQPGPDQGFEGPYRTYILRSPLPMWYKLQLTTH